MAVVWCRFFRSSQPARQPALLEARAAADRQTSLAHCTLQHGDGQTDRRSLSLKAANTRGRRTRLSTFRGVSEVNVE